MEIKKEKGSITLFVLISCLFMIIILLVVNIGVMNKNRSQEKNLEEIAKQYSQNETDLNNAYLGEIDENSASIVSQLINVIYPVGSIYITTNEQNPGEYLGGEWESYGEGRTIVGAGTGTDENNVQKMFEINQTGGEYQHTLTVNEMPSHNHTISSATLWAWNSSYPINSSEMGGTKSRWNAKSISTDTRGGSQAHNNIQPYVVTYMWKRIS